MTAGPDGYIARVTEVSATSTDGTVVTASAEGDGPTLLVLHPGGQDADSWSYVARELVPDFLVVRLHRRIYAARSLAAQAHSMAIEVADTSAIARLLPEPVLLVGHSSGAVVALEAALAHPELFAGVVAYEPPMPTTSLVGGAALHEARAALDRGDPLEAMRIHFTDIVRMPASMFDAMLTDPDTVATLTEFTEPQIRDDEALDSLGVGIDRYRSLSLPVTLIEGELSVEHLRARLADLASTLPNVHVVTLPGQGHIAHIGAPDLLAEAIRHAADARY